MAKKITLVILVVAFAIGCIGSWFNIFNMDAFTKFLIHFSPFYLGLIASIGYRIDINSGETELLSEKLLAYGDGHPSVFENKMLFDSYPDRSRMQHLYIYHIENDTLQELGEFLSPLKYFGSNRCDLHPRWSPDGKDIFIDSTHESKRILYKITL